MARERVIAAIDIGTTKVCTLIGGIVKSGDVEVVGIGVSPSRGLKKGVIVDLDATVESIQASIDKAERTSGFKIVSAHVGISGEHVASMNNRGVIAVNHPDRVITSDDVARVIDAARAVTIPANREIIHLIPRNYSIDGQGGVKNPAGMYGFRLEVEAHIVSGAVTTIQNLTKCVNRTGVDVDDLVLQAVASAEAVLTDEERETGVLLADIGSGTTDLALIVDGSVWHTSCLPVGGNHLTNDVAIGLRLPFNVAEELKHLYGSAQASAIDPGESAVIPAVGGEERRQIPRRHLCDILQARVEEIIEMIVADVKRSGYDGLLPAGIVLTGGTANLRGIDLAARDYLQGLPVRIGTPHGLRGLTDTVSNPAYAAGVGLLLWGLKFGDHEVFASSKGRKSGGLYNRLIGWAKELLPR